MLVRIIKDWDYPDLMAQSPGYSGIWEGIRFTTEPIEKCDYAVVLNRVKEPTTLVCPPEHIWSVMQEPYMPGIFEWMRHGHESFARVYTHDTFSDDPKYIRSFPMLCWHILKSYDELVAIETPPEKRAEISAIVSNKAFFPGHKMRLKFMEKLQTNPALNIDYYGKGIRFIEDKWEGLAPYKYSLAIENSQSSDYWTEKIADCFLAYTMPIYYGCENLEDYFPKESFIQIDIGQPEEAIRIIREAMDSDLWTQNLDAIKEARSLVLNRYSLFPALAREIVLNEQENQATQCRKVTIQPYRTRLWQRVLGKIQRSLVCG